MDLREVPEGPFQRHPWEMARWRFFYNVLDEGGVLAAPTAVLDVGSGDAFFARSLVDEAETETRVTCWDTAYDDSNRHLLPDNTDGKLSYCAQQPADRFGLVLLLDVLEHVDHDVDFLRDIVDQNVQAPGHVLISVPARMLLFSRHDRYLRHYRRYAPRELREVITQAGLIPLRSGGLFHSLAPIRFLQKTGEVIASRLFDQSDDPGAQVDYKGLGNWRGGARLTSMLTGTLAADTWLSLKLSRLGLDLPGLSWWALCKTQRS